VLQFFKCTSVRLFMEFSRLCFIVVHAVQFELANGGTASFLSKDLTISCEGTRYKRHIPFAAAMVLVFPVGIPLTYSVFLFRKRHTLRNAALMKKEALTGYPTTGHLLFLTEQYKPKYYYFGIS
jgi:hypothetical protein